MGKNSGGVRNYNYSEGGKNAYSRAVDGLRNSIEAKSKEGLQKAKKRMKDLISKMSDEMVYERADGFGYASYVTQKGIALKSEYSATRHKYNFEMSKLYNSEANKRRRRKIQ